MLLVVIGVAAATAVITGALLVGDSVRGSLRHLVLDRLGRVQYIVQSPRMFPATALKRLGESSQFPDELEKPIGAILFPRATAELLKGDVRSRASSIQLIACTPAFWELDRPRGLAADRASRDAWPQDRQVVLNQGLADELGARVGDVVTLYLPAAQAVPADSPLGKRDDLTQALPQLKVIGIVPNAGLGSFDLRSNQQAPRNVFVPIQVVQDALDRPDQINTILIANKESLPIDPVSRPATTLRMQEQLLAALKPTLADIGLQLRRRTRRFPDPELGEKAIDTQPTPASGPITIFDYYELTSQELLIPSAAVEAVQVIIPQPQSQPLLTGLANRVEKTSESRGGPSDPSEPPKAGPRVTYSTVASLPPQSPLWDTHRVPSGSVLINAWLAERLSIAPGDRLKIYYYLPETLDGKEVERDFEVQVAGIVPLTKPQSRYRRARPALFAQAPTIYNDPHLTPEVPGVTDQESIDDWDLPFSVGDVPLEDDTYYEEHRLTPRILMPLADGQRWFGSRFGQVSAIRFQPSVAGSLAELEARLADGLAGSANKLGLAVIPLRAQQLKAASGTTPFDMLFVSLSFFVIVAGLVLVMLLFRLGIEQRASQWGLLLSLGWPERKVRQLLGREGLVLSGVGSCLGIVLGIAYAQLMMAGLRTWWVGAVSVPFLSFHWTWWSLFLGGLAGCISAWCAIAMAVRGLRRVTARDLLQGRMSPQTNRVLRSMGIGSWLVLALIIGALGVLATGWGLSGQSQAGAYLGGGMLLLCGGVLATYRWLSDQHASGWVKKGLVSLAQCNASRNPLRSTLALGLMSLASFLVVAISLFRMRPDDEGTGGYQWIGDSSQPIARNLADAVYRRQVLGPKEDRLQGLLIHPMRMRPGDDASCNNLYQSREPRVLGIPASLREDPGGRQFRWAAIARNVGKQDSPWRGLRGQRSSDSPGNRATPIGSRENPIPVILDQNTAMWSLHKGAALGEVFSFEMGGRTIHFQTSGLLQNTILQGSLMIAEEDFQELFPTINGYQFFLIRSAGIDSKTADATAAEAAQILESGWADEGLDTRSAAEHLAQLLSVQNTYLSAFQSLGALGLLLGAVGLAVVLMRSAYERRGELALLRSVGFSQSRLQWLLMLENGFLLLLGIALGCICAAVAMGPALLDLGGLDVRGPATMVGLVLLLGLMAGGWAAHRATRIPTMDALRGR
jgi:ABC-type lipoprotein release transport system permease subunit